MEFVAEKDILAPPDRVFELMADARNETRWNSHVTRSELVSGEPVGAGSVFKTVNRGQEYTATITTHEPPNRVAFEVTGKTMDITAAFDFRAGSDVTHMAARFDFRPKGFMKALFPLMSPLVRRDMPKQLERFRQICEPGAGAS